MKSALTKVQRQRLEILQWEQNNRNLGNRSMAHKRCSYRSSTTSPGCAVGRLLSARQRKKLAIREDNNEWQSVLTIFSELPKRLQILGENFLTELQRFHDFPNHFTETGLSNSGQIEIECLINRYCK